MTPFYTNKLYGIRVVSVGCVMLILLAMGGSTSAQFLPPDAIVDIAWQPDGNLLAVAYIRGEVAVYQQPENTLVFQRNGLHMDEQVELYRLAWDHSGSQLAIPDGDRIYIYDTNYWQVNLTIERSNPITGEPLGDLSEIVDVAWSGDDRYLASVSYGGSPFNVRVWDITTGDEIAILDTSGAYMFSVSFAPNSQYLLTTSGIPWLWELPNIEPQALLRAEKSYGDTLQAAWSPDGQFVATVGNSNLVVIWDATTLQAVREFVGHVLAGPLSDDDHVPYIYDVKWSADGTRLASVASDGTVRIWDAVTGDNIQTITVGEELYAVSFSPDGSQVAYGGESGDFHISAVAAP